jgi:hypothetical protein
MLKAIIDSGIDKWYRVKESIFLAGRAAQAPLRQEEINENFPPGFRCRYAN